MTTQSMPNWRVTGLTPSTEFAPNVGAVQGYRVQFETDTGLAGSIFVATAQIRDDAAVRAAVTAHIRSLVALHNLSS